MKNFLLIIPTCAGLLLMSSCVAPSIGPGTYYDSSEQLRLDDEAAEQRQTVELMNNTANAIAADTAAAAYVPPPPAQ